MGLGVDLTVETDEFGTDSREWLGTALGTQSTRTCTIDCDDFIGETINGAVLADGDFLPSGVAIVVDDDGVATFADGSLESTSIAVDATSGTWTAAVEGEVTAALQFNVSAANLLAALEGLPGIDPGEFTVTGGPGDAGATTPYVVARTTPGDMPNIVVADVDLAGGGADVVATITAGAGASEASGHLYSGIKLRAGRKIGAALYEIGKVRVSKLPTGWGLSRAPHIIYLP